MEIIKPIKMLLSFKTDPRTSVSHAGEQVLITIVVVVEKVTLMALSLIIVIA